MSLRRNGETYAWVYIYDLFMVLLLLPDLALTLNDIPDFLNGLMSPGKCRTFG
jgi:hypothetical protein